MLTRCSLSDTQIENASIYLDDVRVDYYVGGAGLPPIILVHGLNSHAGSWRKNIHALGTIRQTFAITMPRMDHPSIKVKAVWEAQLVERFITQLEVPAATIVGHSLGGWVAMLYAAKHPECVCSLILEDTALPVDNHANEDLAGNFSRLGVPVLIVWGEKDTLIAPKVGEAIHSAIAGSELVVFRDVGHVPHWETPDAYNATLIDFIQRKNC